MRRPFSLGSIIWLVFGLVVAGQHGYAVFTNISQILSFILAVLLWPLLFFGANLHLSLGF